MPFGIATKKIASIDASVAYAAGGRVAIPLPNEYNISAIQIRVAGAITVGTADALAVQAGGAANVFSNVRIQSRDGSRLDVTGLELQLLNRFQHQNSVEQTDPALTQGDKTFAVTLTREFAMPRMVIPTNTRGILPCRLVRDMELQLQIAPPTDILQPNTTTTLVYKAGTTIEVTIFQAVDSPSDPDYYLNEQVFAKQYPNQTTATGELEILLEAAGKYRHFILYSKSLTTGLYAMSDALLNNVKMIVSRQEIINQSWAGLGEDNRQNFLMTATVTGVRVLDFTRNANPNELLPGDVFNANGQTLSLLPNTGTAGAGSIFGVIGVRIWDNPRAPLIPVANA